MAEGLVLEFTGIGREQYDAVNSNLGIDSATGAGDWPAGMTFHSGGLTDDGLVVTEVWESREAQAAFMESRLGPALAQAGITGPPTRVTWATLIAVQNLAG